MSLCKQTWVSCFLLCILISTTTSNIENGDNPTKQMASSNSSVTSVIIFGDSTVDPGNNDFINTIFRSNFPPYGVDFPNQSPTGRFTNGRLATDFIGNYLTLSLFLSLTYIYIYIAVLFVVVTDLISK